jgi:allophanate hydrolase subunit 2
MSTRLTMDAWTVENTSRVGLRLAGSAVRRVLDDELVSEGLVAGAIQVPPDGQPVVMLADHPTTGGYPVIAVVDPDDLAALAQRRVGSIVRFSHAQ